MCRMGQSVFWSPENVTYFHSKLLLCSFKFHNIKDEQLNTITSLILLKLTMLPSLCPISSKQTVSSNQCLRCYTGFKVIVAQDRTPKRGCRWPPSTILIDGVPVEGVEEFIYLGNKQSSNGYCRPDLLCRIGLACSVMNSLQRVWNCSSVSVSTKVHLYQAQIRSVLL